MPEAQRKALVAQIEKAMQKAKPSRIASLGPARQDESKPRVLLVSYQIEATPTISGEAFARRLTPSSNWLVSGGL